MAFVVTAGQIERVAPQITSATWGSGFTPLPGPVQLAAGVFMTYEQIWRVQPSVRTVVAFLARNIAQLGLFPYRRLANNDRVKAVDHPLHRLLERPFLGTKWTRYRLIEWTVSELCIYDNAFWIKGRVADQQTLMPMPRRFVQPHGENPLMPDFYRIQGTRGYRDIAPDQVVHFHGYNPEDPRYGVPPIETLRQVLAEEYAASVYREQMWRNGARTGGYIKRPKDAPRWSDTARDRFKHDWNSQYSGNGVYAGGTPVLEDGMEFSPSGVTPREAQYVESRKLTREEVAVAYAVPPVLMGILEGATVGNVTQFHKMLYQDTLGPWIARLAQDIENQLLPDLDPIGAFDGSVYVEFNLSEKLRGGFEEQAAAISASVGAPWMTRQEARSMFNLPHVDGADDLITPLNVVTGGLASPRDTAPDNPRNEESNGQLPAPRPPT